MNSFRDEISRCSDCKDHKRIVAVDWILPNNIVKEIIDSKSNSLRSSGMVSDHCDICNKNIKDSNSIPNWCPKLDDNLSIKMRFETLRETLDKLDQVQLAKKPFEERPFFFQNMGWNLKQLEKLIEKLRNKE